MVKINLLLFVLVGLWTSETKAFALRQKDKTCSLKSLKNTLLAENVVSSTGTPTWSSPHGKKGELAREVLAGMVVSLATIPTSIAYSTVAGVNPLVGIWSSVIVGGLVTVFGGGPGMIAGAAGVIAVPMANLVGVHGTAYMGAAIMLAGLFEVLFGIFKLGRILDMVTEPVVVGFMNAFALFLVKSQIKNFQSSPGVWLPSAMLIPAASIAALCAGLINLVPYVAPKLPASLIGLIGSSLVAVALHLPLKSLGDIADKSTFAGGLSALPTFVGLPTVSFTMDMFKIIAPVSLGVAIISLIETVLAARIAQNKVKSNGEIVYEEMDSNRLSIGLGIANAVSAAFGGFGGCGLIPNTILNSKSGGSGYASGFAFSSILAAAVVLCSPLLAKIPLAALAGLMLNVAKNTVEWQETKHLIFHASNSLQSTFNFVAMIVTLVVCFKVDMGLGVFLGFVVATLPQLFEKLVGLVRNAKTI